jgi:hypothetical protein
MEKIVDDYKYSFRMDENEKSPISSEKSYMMKIEYKNFLFTYHIDNFYFEEYEFKYFIKTLKNRKKCGYELIPERCLDCYDMSVRIIPHILYDPETDENAIIFEQKSYQRNVYGSLFRIAIPYDNYVIQSLEEFNDFIINHKKNVKKL